MEKNEHTVSMLALDVAEEIINALERRVDYHFFKEQLDLKKQQDEHIHELNNELKFNSAANQKKLEEEFNQQQSLRLKQKLSLDNHLLYYRDLAVKARGMQFRHIPRRPLSDQEAHETRKRFEEEIGRCITGMKKHPQYKDLMPTIYAIKAFAEKKDLSDFEKNAYDPRVHKSDNVSRIARQFPEVTELLETPMTESEIRKQHHYDNVTEDYVLAVNAQQKGRS